jgi:mannosidase alpha-like ER degradation enhancer 2
MKTTFILLVTMIMLATTGISPAQKFTSGQKNMESEKIKSACQYAWSGYKQYAWGYDALKPVSKVGQNWYTTSLLMTPLDAFDTFMLLGLNQEASEAKDIILSKLTFDLDMEVQLFEINIRMLGGLLSAYEFDSDKRFLLLAEDLGKRLLPAFVSGTGMPYRFVNLRTGKTRDAMSNPAEIGTYLLEFGRLTQYTGDSAYYKAAKKATLEVYKRRSDIGLVGTIIDVNTGEWKNTESQIGARIDSYYEYLFKASRLFGDKDCQKAWERSKEDFIRYLLSKTHNGWYFTRVNMHSGIETHPYYGALEAFSAGLLALSGDISTARNIQKGNYHMWTRFNIEPEEFDFKADTIIYPNYPLRPENIESCFYLYRFTKDDEYLRMGQRMIDDILTRCKTGAGYAEIKDVRTFQLDDVMESFFFAETLKYAYLLFAPVERLDLDKYVFTTEAHPLKVR